MKQILQSRADPDYYRDEERRRQYVQDLCSAISILKDRVQAKEAALLARRSTAAVNVSKQPEEEMDGENDEKR